MLLQTQDNGDNAPVSFAGRSLTDVERRYSQTEKEALAVVWACAKYHLYLYGRLFDLITDHKPLEFIYSMKSKPSARLERWVLRLQPYEYNIMYAPGHTNIADALSRLMSDKGVVQKTNVSVEYIHFVSHSAVPKAMTLTEIGDASANYPELTRLHQCIQYGQWQQCDKEYIKLEHELTNFGDIITSTCDTNCT